MKVWLLQIPRLNDQVTAGIKAVSQILTDNAVNNEIIDLNHELYVKYFKTDLWNSIDKFGY